MAEDDAAQTVAQLQQAVRDLESLALLEDLQQPAAALPTSQAVRDVGNLATAENLIQD